MFLKPFTGENIIGDIESKNKITKEVIEAKNKIGKAIVQGDKKPDFTTLQKYDETLNKQSDLQKQQTMMLELYNTLMQVEKNHKTKLQAAVEQKKDSLCDTERRYIMLTTDLQKSVARIIKDIKSDLLHYQQKGVRTYDDLMSMNKKREFSALNYLQYLDPLAQITYMKNLPQQKQD